MRLAGRRRTMVQLTSSPLRGLQGLSSWICQRPPWLEWPTSCWTGLSTRSRSGLRTERSCFGSCCSNTGAPACPDLGSTPKGAASLAPLPRALPRSPSAAPPTRLGPTFLPGQLLPLTPLEGWPCVHAYIWEPLAPRRADSPGLSLHSFFWLHLVIPDRGHPLTSTTSFRRG